MMSKAGMWMLTLLWSLLGVVSILPAAFGVTILDAPGAEKQFSTWCLGLAVMTFPLVCFTSVATSWQARRREKHLTSQLYLLLPLVNLLVGALAMGWIHTMHDGKFAP